jgi:PAS domain S-box-containing protein
MQVDDSVYKQIVENAGDAIIVTDREGTITVWNAGAERIFGVPRDKAVGETVEIIIPENQRDLHWTGYDKVLETGITQYGGADLLAVQASGADSSLITVEMSFVALRDGDEVSAVAAIIRERRRPQGR